MKERLNLQHTGIGETSSNDRGMNAEKKMPGAQIAVHSHCNVAAAWMETPLDNKQMINRQKDQLLLQLNSNLLSLACRILLVFTFLL